LGKNLLNNLKLSEEIDLEEFKKNIVNARKNKNLSIKEASQILNISEGVIKKLEEGNFEEISKDIFIIGHIRTYLNLIDIDPKLLIDNFKPKKIIFKKNNQNIILPYSFNISRKYIFLISIILFFFLLIIYKEINTVNKINIISDENTEKELENITDQETAIQEIGDLEEKEEKNSEPDENKIESQSDEIITSEIKNIDFIYIEASEDSWIEIQDKNSKVLVSKIIKKNEKMKLVYEKDLMLVTGNAGGIIIKIENNIINNIGKFGEVKRNISLNLENLIKYIDE
tara:strand:- start:1203 stop:2057 length:855 start_codon:yes stop_codon:yes gene_type:complete